MYHYNGTKKCHDYKKPVFVVDNLYIYGGAEREIKYEEYDAVIRLLESKPSITEIFGTGIFKDLENILTTKTSILHLPIRDMSAPNYGVGLWIGLVELLKQAAKKQEKPFKVAIHCMGGHGRTGLVLAIIGLILGELPHDPKEAIIELRKRYCHKAVESEEQLSYIFSIGYNLEYWKDIDDAKGFLNLASKGYGGSSVLDNYVDIDSRFNNTDYEYFDEEEDLTILDELPRDTKCTDCKYFDSCLADEEDTPFRYNCIDFEPKEEKGGETDLD